MKKKDKEVILIVGIGIILLAIFGNLFSFVGSPRELGDNSRYFNYDSQTNTLKWAIERSGLGSSNPDFVTVFSGEARSTYSDIFKDIIKTNYPDKFSFGGEGTCATAEGAGTYYFLICPKTIGDTDAMDILVNEFKCEKGYPLIQYYVDEGDDYYEATGNQPYACQRSDVFLSEPEMNCRANVILYDEKGRVSPLDLGTIQGTFSGYDSIKHNFACSVDLTESDNWDLKERRHQMYKPTSISENFATGTYVEFKINDNWIVETHTICQNEQCITIESEGTDECSTDMHCATIPQPPPLNFWDKLAGRWNDFINFIRNLIPFSIGASKETIQVNKGASASYSTMLASESIVDNDWSDGSITYLYGTWVLLPKGKTEFDNAIEKDKVSMDSSSATLTFSGVINQESDLYFFVTKVTSEYDYDSQTWSEAQYELEESGSKLIEYRFSVSEYDGSVDTFWSGLSSVWANLIDWFTNIFN